MMAVCPLCCCWKWGHCAKGHLVPLGMEHLSLQLRSKDMQGRERIQGSFLLSESVGDSAYCERHPASQSYLKALTWSLAHCMAQVAEAPEQRNRTPHYYQL